MAELHNSKSRGEPGREEAGQDSGEDPDRKKLKAKNELSGCYVDDSRGSLKLSGEDGQYQAAQNGATSVARPKKMHGGTPGARAGEQELGLLEHMRKQGTSEGPSASRETLRNADLGEQPRKQDREGSFPSSPARGNESNAAKTREGPAKSEARGRASGLRPREEQPEARARSKPRQSGAYLVGSPPQRAATTSYVKE